MQIRQPAVAGLFYPAEALALKTQIDELLAQARASPPLPDLESLRALIVPHAGYIYSGQVAANAYHLLEQYPKPVKRVLLLGPSHRVPLAGIALPDASAFSTALGNIPLDTASMTTLENLPRVTKLPQAHELEHSLEVQLPFLQTVLDDFTLVPLVVGQTEPDTVEQVLNLFADDPDTFIVISTDLSHFLDYDTARHVDRNTSDTIEERSCTLNGEQACGCYPLNGLLKLARQHNWQVTTLDLRNSGDASGPLDRVVGYGAYAVFA